MSANLTITIPAWLDFIFAWPVLLYRRLRFGYTFRKIYLGQGEFTIVEPPDYYTFSKFNWILTRCDGKPYAVSEFKIGRLKTKRMYLHRAIMHAPRGKLVDHRNGGSLDNRTANLRLATYAQNARNRKKRKNASSRFIGVCLEKRTDRWQTKIYFRGKPVSLGCFDSESDAARAFDVAALKYHKDFARTNFPREDYVKVRNEYKFVGESRAGENPCSLRAKLCKIYSTTLGRFGKQKKKGRFEL